MLKFLSKNSRKIGRVFLFKTILQFWVPCKTWVFLVKTQRNRIVCKSQRMFRSAWLNPVSVWLTSGITRSVVPFSILSILGLFLSHKRLLGSNFSTSHTTEQTRKFVCVLHFKLLSIKEVTQILITWKMAPLRSNFSSSHTPYEVS